MSNFNLGNLLSWSQVSTGEVLPFDVDESNIRAVEFDFMASEDVVVVAVTPEWSIPIACGSGLNSVRFVTDRSVGISFLGHDDATITIRTRTESQVVEDDGSVSYTSIEPRQAHPSDDMQRMMNLMRLNQLRRDQELRAEFEAREEQLIERIEKTRAPSLTERAQAAAQAEQDAEAPHQEGEPTDGK